jgi:hypothetical protein
MAVDEEALRMNGQLAIAAAGDDRLDQIGRLAFQRTARGDNGYAHDQELMSLVPASAMAAKQRERRGAKC